MLYYTYFDICAFIQNCICLLFIVRKKRKAFPQTLLFALLILNGIFSSVFGITSTALEAVYAGTGTVLFIENFSLFFYYAVHTALAPLYALYVLVINGSALGRGRRFFAIFFAPFYVTELLIFLNPVFHWIYYYDASGVHHRGPLLMLAYTCAALYMLLSYIYLTRYRDAIPSDTGHMLNGFLLLILLGVIIQFLFPNLKVELFFQTIGYIAILMTVENDEASLDIDSGAYNRTAFMKENTRLLNSGQHYYVIAVNLSSMKYYYRVLDYKVIGEVLRDIASWMETLPYRLKVFHFDIGNFVIIPNSRIEGDVNRIVGLLRARLEQDWIFDEITLSFHDSVISIARIPDDFDTVESVVGMVENADLPVANEITIQFGDDLKHIKREMDVEKALRSAIEQKSFEVFYQPIWAVATDDFRSAEALVRLTDAELGFISPGEFIPIAEKNGLIADIGEIVFEKVCSFIHSCDLPSYGIDSVEVNLSVHQLMSASLVQFFESVLHRFHVPASFLNLEITESAAMDGSSLFADVLNDLRRTGFEFSLDDYGTGYSNLSNIMRINFRNIKIDKSILYESEHSVQTKVFLEDTISSLRKQGVNVIQEGVETKEQLEYLIQAGANYIQGFYFSKPLNEESFLAFLKDYR